MIRSSRGGSNMVSRIGDVLYWLGRILAAILVVAGIVSYVLEGYRRSDGFLVLVIVLVLALIPLLIGKASRYVLSPTR
jgi:hypothetical protein